MSGIKGHSCEKIRKCKPKFATVPTLDNPAKPIGRTPHQASILFFDLLPALESWDSLTQHAYEASGSD